VRPAAGDVVGGYLAGGFTCALHDLTGARALWSRAPAATGSTPLNAPTSAGFQVQMRTGSGGIGCGYPGAQTHAA
jgi:acyl-coenzyme A thioesterase PaaI-like protein